MKDSPSGRASLRDIALRLGVGRMTVSRALRGLPGVGNDLRSKVLKEAVALGYALDPAMSEAMGRFRRSRALEYRETVAFLSPEPHLRHNQLLIAGAEALARQLNYKLELFNPQTERFSSRQVSRVLHNRGIRGVIVSPYGRARYPHLALEWRRFATVLIGSSLVNQGLPRVQLDHFATCKLTVRHLHHAGYRRVGLLLEDSHHERTNRQILAAYATWNPPSREGKSGQWVHIVDSPEDWTGVDAWIAQSKLDCLVAPSYRWQGFFARKKAAAGHLPWAALETGGKPGITGINTSHAFRKIGTEAMRLLDSHLRARVLGTMNDPLTILIPGRWQEGKTAGPRQGRKLPVRRV
jgi:LacI family transcriptional regulator